jgi:8-oxo-dGTP pyrophosphatase MutT (NUDIX family)
MMTHSAGVLPFFDNKILLGREERGWSAFSGKSEGDETPLETAVREFQEETANIFADVAILETACLKSITPRGIPFFLFLSCFKTPCVDANEQFQIQRRLTKNQREMEKRELMWVNVDDIYSIQLSKSFAMEWLRIKKLIYSANPAIRDMGGKRT